MDVATKHTIRTAVTDILRSADIDSVTERAVRETAAARLNLDLSDVASKILVSDVIETFLLSTAPSPEEIARRIASVTTAITNSGDGVELLTVQEVIRLVREKVGLDVFVLSQCDVIRHVITTLFESAGVGDNSPAKVEERKRRIEGVVGEALKSSHMRVCDVIDGVRDSELIVTQISSGDVNVSTDQEAGNVAGEPEDIKPVIAPPGFQHNPVASESCRVICKLSNKRDVAVRGYGENAVVSLRELFCKDGKQIPQPKGITLSNEQWSIFRKSVPAIEEAIQKVESRLSLRSELKKKQDEDKHDGSQHESIHNYDTQCRAQLIQNGEHHGHRPVLATGKHTEETSTVGPTPQGLVPVGIIRFDGKNYLKWADCLDSYLNKSKIAYVLSEPCPSVAGVIERELGQTLSAIQKWIDDDHICRHNILNSLCDNLFCHYSKKQGTARDLWEELKLIFLNEEYGANVSLVKKYIEYEMFEEKSIFDQVQELHEIADSLIASGMYVEEMFHVNAIISKLPPSWKPFSVHLMKEDYLPVWMLMNLLKSEEESRGKGNMSGASVTQPIVPIVQLEKRSLVPMVQLEKRSLAPKRTIPMKNAGVPSTNYESERDRKVKFCTVCKKRGHVLEQCWYRNSGGKDTAPSGKDNCGSVDTVAGRGTNDAT